MPEAENDSEFLTRINENLGIAHKVARAYFDDGDDRNDIIQEMMYQLWRSYRNFKGNSKFSTWMYSVCLNTALTFRKKSDRQKREALSGTHEDIASTGATDQKPMIDRL